MTSGEEKWYTTNKVALKDIRKQINGMVSISHDMTKRKAIESALVTSETQLTNALRIAKLAYWEYDVPNDLFTFNDQFYMLLRTTAEKEGGYKMSSSRYARRFVYPEDRPMVGIEIQKSIQASGDSLSRQLEHRVMFADGETGHFSVHFYVLKDSSGKTVKTYGANQDITVRKQAEEALRFSEYLLRKSQSVANMGTFHFDLKTGLWDNSAKIDDIFGLTDNFVKDIEGWMQIIHPLERSEMDDYFNNQLLAKQKRFEKEYRIIRLNDGQERWVYSIADIEFDSDGNPLRMIGTTQDITERILREKEKLELEKQLRQRNTKLENALIELKQMQGSLVQSEKMASLGQLTAGIAHEINNPLSFVSSNINRLKEYFNDTHELLKKWQALDNALEDKEEFKNDLESIRKFTDEIDLGFIIEDFGLMMGSINEGTQRIKKIVEGLRGFAHIADSSISQAPINPAIDETLTIVWNEIKYKAAVKKEYGDIPPVMCNIGEIKQVLVNLLVNAAQAINEKGIITISTFIEKEWLKIKIKDTGNGISKENMIRIFDPFFTTKPVGKGTGLGLWVSSSIIEKHGGTLTVESTEGTGSTFTIKLPANGKVSKLKKDKDEL